MIRRLLISTLLTALAALAVSAAKPAEKTDSLTAADFFANAPLRIFPTIDRTTRLDMLDYYRSGSDKPSKTLSKGMHAFWQPHPRRLPSLLPTCRRWSSR